jgi:hypothetical protein
MSEHHHSAAHMQQTAGGIKPAALGCLTDGLFVVFIVAA